LFNFYPLCKSMCSKNRQACLFVTVCILSVLFLSACTSRSIYLNKDFNPPVYFGQHVVQKGDTLYSIAWRYGREMKELALENKIKSPYVIIPGQKISLEMQNKNLNSSNRRSTKESNVTKRKESIPNGKNVTKNKKTKNIKNIKWRWPHLGPILAKYNLRTSRSKGIVKEKSSGNLLKINKGVDITGKLGSPVYAAADGEVVYAGNGLLGYGNLVIINHNEAYLSAYAHNQQVLVKEGQKVKIGRKIAEMGSSGSKQVKLHFEIRRNGEPVDPMKYLPAR
jgi:lipoprotein NlpD